MTEYRVSEGTQKSMRANRGSETKPEQELRKALWRKGLRGYRKNFTNLPGKPDIAFTRYKLAIFIHGCFWHGCERCSSKRNLKPKANENYWLNKIARNKERDQRNRDQLIGMNWIVLEVWECELNQNLNDILTSIEEVTQNQRKQYD